MLSTTNSLSAHALAVLQADALLPTCTACGTQYPLALRSTCPICEDPRQFVPASGQSWTTLAELQSSRTTSLLRDDEDSRITFIQTEPAFGINQTPILIETHGGSYIWDCATLISPSLIGHLELLKSPLKAMAISHPHFFTTSLTWARALQIPLYLCEADREWFQRLPDVKDDDDIRWFTDEALLGHGVKVIQCGGHFSGSSILHWDRLSEPPPSQSDLPTKPTPVSGIIFTADTIMVQPHQHGFTFPWSVPNLIPLRPKDVVQIQTRLKDVPFHEATSTWPNRFVRLDAKKVLEESVTAHLAACGWRKDGDILVPDTSTT